MSWIKTLWTVRTCGSICIWHCGSQEAACLNQYDELGLGLHFSGLLNKTLNLGISGWGLALQGKGGDYAQVCLRACKGVPLQMLFASFTLLAFSAWLTPIHSEEFCSNILSLWRLVGFSVQKSLLAHFPFWLQHWWSVVPERVGVPGSKDFLSFYVWCLCLAQALEQHKYFMTVWWVNK